MRLIEPRYYYRCDHCGTYQFPDTVEADGIRIVGPVADALSCPVCTTMLLRALLDAHPVDFCETCRGVLLPRQTFAGVVNARRAWATTTPADPVPLEREELQRMLDCPRCRNPFETYPNYGPGNVVIDSCRTCDLVWLDFGEMRQIVDAPGRDRGSRQMPRIDEEFVRHGPPREPEDDEPERFDVLDLLASWMKRS